MKTLAQFKKDLRIGDVIIVTSVKNDHVDNKGVLFDIPIPEKLQGERKVSYIDTTGFYLKDNNDFTDKKGSFCGYPKASNLKYDGDTFTIQDNDDGRIWCERTYQKLYNRNDIPN